MQPGRNIYDGAIIKSYSLNTTSKIQTKLLWCIHSIISTKPHPHWQVPAIGDAAAGGLVVQEPPNCGP